MSHRFSFGILCSISVALGAVAQENPQDQKARLLRKITAYETLFTRSAITIRTKTPASTYKQNPDFPHTGTGIRYLYDGENKRSDETYFGKDGINEYRTAVSDGKVRKEWYRGDDDPSGKGVVAQAGSSDSARFECHLLMPHTYNLFEYPAIDVLEETPTRVQIRYTLRQDYCKVVTYEPVGEYLRPLTIESISTKSGVQEQAAAAIYTYETGAPETNPKLWPISIREVCKPLEIDSLCPIVDVDFDPEITPETFSLDFPDKAWVNDKILDYSSRLHKNDAKLLDRLSKETTGKPTEAPSTAPPAEPEKTPNPIPQNPDSQSANSACWYLAAAGIAALLATGAAAITRKKRRSRT